MFLILILFIQALTIEKGIVYYENSRVYFKNLKNQVRVVEGWQKLKTPTDQLIEVSYELKDNKIYQLKMTDAFREKYRESNRIMREAEKLSRTRQFPAAYDSLKRVEALNEYLPYLYRDLLFIASEIRDEAEVLTIIKSFEDKSRLIPSLEKSIFYYQLYEYWRNRFDRSNSKAHLNNGILALTKSQQFRPDDEKARILNTMRIKLESLSDE